MSCRLVWTVLLGACSGMGTVSFGSESDSDLKAQRPIAYLVTNLRCAEPEVRLRLFREQDGASEMVHEETLPWSSEERSVSSKFSVKRQGAYRADVLCGGEVAARGRTRISCLKEPATLTEWIASLEDEGCLSPEYVCANFRASEAAMKDPDLQTEYSRAIMRGGVGMTLQMMAIEAKYAERFGCAKR